MGDKGIHEDHFLSLTRLLLLFFNFSIYFFIYFLLFLFETWFQGQFFIFVILSLTNSLSIQPMFCAAAAVVA